MLIIKSFQLSSVVCSRIFCCIMYLSVSSLKIIQYVAFSVFSYAFFLDPYFHSYAALAYSSISALFHNPLISVSEYILPLVKTATFLGDIPICISIHFLIKYSIVSFSELFFVSKRMGFCTSSFQYPIALLLFVPLKLAEK